jgi:cytochrome c oxidase subunit II
MNTDRAVGMAFSSSLIALSCLVAPAIDQMKVIKINAKRFEFEPSEITIEKGTPVVLQLTSEDRTHGFNIQGMNLRTYIEPGKVSEVVVTPQMAGQYDFYCDVFCGSGHEGMAGKITVTD